MMKPNDSRPGPEPEPGEASTDGKRRRLRLHPRRGSEHQFGFARRWEARRRSRSGRGIWALVGMDVGIVFLIYMIARALLKKLGVE